MTWSFSAVLEVATIISRHLTLSDDAPGSGDLQSGQQCFRGCLCYLQKQYVYPLLLLSGIILRFRGISEKKNIECQDALEAAARAEGLPLDTSVHSQLRMLDEEHHKGKYHHGLNALKPIRTTSKHQHPVDNAGLFSSMTFSWLTPLAHRAYKKGELFMDDVWSLSGHESSDVNCRRLERLWQEELKESGPDDASLRRVVWIFCRTRLILSIVCLMITQLAGFSGPVSNIHPFFNNPRGLHLMANCKILRFHCRIT